MKIPNPESAVIDAEKIRDYLLSSTHPVGRLKAVFFNALGYRESDWGRLRMDIQNAALLETASPGRFTRYGNNYELRANLNGPSGRSANVLDGLDREAR